jgi:hypothetical protein
LKKCSGCQGHGICFGVVGLHFLPEEFTRTRRLPFLDADERRTLSQIRSYVYLKMFVNIEAFVMPLVVDQAMLEPEADAVRTRALLEFAAEEAKHTQMLNRFAEAFDEAFPALVQVIGPPEEIAARMDKVLVECHAATLAPAEIARGIDAYFEIGEFFDAGLQAQVRFDLESFQLATGRRLDPEQRELFLAEQLQALRWTFLGSVMVQRRFLETLERLKPGTADRALEVAARMR